MKTALSGPVRVRFAPSPTGFLHVGGARTAIYNDLLRRSLGGAFILRIEDTDKERSDEAMTRQIQSALAWIGVEWDEGPYLQSERLSRHRERAGELIAAGRAYRCFCPPAELEAARAAAQKQGATYRYARTCLGLSQEEIARRLGEGSPFAVRFKMPEGEVRFADLVRGEVIFSRDVLDDFILLRSDGSPTYHMSVVCDDIDMGVTHVIRGDDHLSNTPKHVPLFEAFGARAPVFGHLPLILGSDRKRLSKRVGSTSVEEFRAEGILPPALYNYLALLGWAPGEDRELMTRAEMIELFTVEGLNAAAAVFDREKLLWFNAQYLMRLPFAELSPHLEPFLTAAGLAGADRGRIAALVELFRQRAATLAELAQSMAPYFLDSLAYDPAECGKFLADPALPGRLEALAGRFAALPGWEVAALEETLRGLAAELGVKAGDLIHPMRMAATAAKGGPPLFDALAVLGREATTRRLASFLAFLRREGAPSVGGGGAG